MDFAKHLEQGLQGEKLKNSIPLILQKQKLKASEAHQLLHELVTMIWEHPEGGMVDSQEEVDLFQDAIGGLSQTQENQSLSQTQENQSLSQTKATHSQSQPNPSSDSQTNKTTPTQICRFYKGGNCKFGKKKCRYAHPEFCQKFTKHGTQKHSSQGCDGKCGLLHPNACKESLRTKVCSRENCRFYHIKGTKSKKQQEKPKEEENPLKDNNASAFLEMQKSMAKAIEDLQKQVENMMIMVRPQVQWMGPSQKPGHHGPCNNC